MKNKNIIKKLFLFIIFGLVLSSIVGAIEIWEYNNTKAIQGSDYYYQDKFGNIFIDEPVGCFDICIFHNFIKLNVDKKTFKVLNSTKIFVGIYAKDKNQVFYEKEKIIGADSSTFEILDSDGTYAKDKNHIYYYGKEIIESDPLTFKKVDFNGNYAKDKNHVFYEGEKINADSPTFKEIIFNGKYFKDKNYVFLGGKEIVGADPSTFKILDSGGKYTKDKNHVFYVGEKINADSPTFKIISDTTYGIYAKDVNQVFCDGKKIPGADPSTFKILDSKGRYSKDINQYYFIETPLKDFLTAHSNPQTPIFNQSIKIKSYSESNFNFIIEMDLKSYLIDQSKSEVEIKEVDGQLKLENSIN